MISSSLCKRRGATLAGVFSLALSCAVLLCGAGSAPIENFLPQGAMQGDLNAGGHNLTNAATVYATAVSATSVSVSGTLTAPSSFTLPFSQLTSTPTTLAGYGITNGEPALGNPSANGYVLSSTTGGARSWIAPGGSLTLDSSVTAVGFSYGSPAAGTLYLANVNAAGGLAELDGSGNLTLAGGVALTAASSLDGGNFTTDGSGDITVQSITANGPFSYFGGSGNYLGFIEGSGIVLGGSGATVDTANGIAIGYTALAFGFGSVAIGGNSQASNGGIAMGFSAAETGGGVNFVYGAYAGTGLAIEADEIAVPNGSGYATLSGRDDGTMPTNTVTPVGYIHIHVNGVDSWVPYYQ